MLGTGRLSIARAIGQIFWGGVGWGGVGGGGGGQGLGR